MVSQLVHQIHHLQLWWRRSAKRDRAIAVAAAGSAIFIFSFSLFISDSPAPNPTQHSSAPLIVPLTLLGNAKQRGAFCLDGSLPGYHLHRGYGSGSANWVLHIEGGGWCDTIESCSARKETALGSSNHMDTMVQFSGILSNVPSQNPDFFNWNKVKIRYCDGASFAGHPESEVKNGTKLLFRGQLIWEAVMDELLSLGLFNAKQALLSGCSAGGLATLIHCDGFKKYLPKDATVKCLSDAGFFLNVKDIDGYDTIGSFYHRVVHLQGVTPSLDKGCVAKMEPHKCFFPQEFIRNIQTPVFLVQPGYDFWQIQHIFVPNVSNSHRSWLKCQLDIRNCNQDQMKVLEGYRDSLLNTLSEFQESKGGGIFVNSCFIHCQTWSGETWHSPTSPRVNNMTIAEAVGDWYFNRKAVRQIDCSYPCNPTCYNMVFDHIR